MSGYRVGVDHGNEDARVGDLGCPAAVAADDTHDASANLPGELKARNEVRADVASRVTASHRKNKDEIPIAQPAHSKPFCITRIPALVVDPRRQLGDVVGGRIRLEAPKLAEVADGVGRVASTAARPDDEQPSLACAELDELANESGQRAAIQAVENFARLGKVPVDVRQLAPLDVCTLRPLHAQYPNLLPCVSERVGRHPAPP